LEVETQDSFLQDSS